MAYGKTSREAVERAPVGGSDFWQPPEGEHRIRVMPPWAEDVEECWFVTATHFNVGPDGRAVPCPAQSGVRESCFLCRKAKKLEKGDADAKAEAEEISARPRYLLNIVDLANPQNGVQVWPAPKTIFRVLKKFWLNEEDYGDFTSFEAGFDILIEKVGSGINTKYDATPTRPKAFPSEKLLNHASDSVSEMYQALKDEEYELPNLAEVQTFISDEEMERVYNGLSAGRARTEPSDNGEEPEEAEDVAAAEAEEPEETPRARKPKPAAATKGDATPRSRIRGRVTDLE